MRLTLLLPLFIALVACAGSGEPDRPDPEDCGRLRQHIADLRLAAADPTGRLDDADRAQHRAALQAAMARPGNDECESRTTAELVCKLAATDLDALRACASSED
jgi:hypothetical protein